MFNSTLDPRTNVPLLTECNNMFDFELPENHLSKRSKYPSKTTTLLDCYFLCFQNHLLNVQTESQKSVGRNKRKQGSKNTSSGRRASDGNCGGMERHVSRRMSHICCFFFVFLCFPLNGFAGVPPCGFQFLVFSFSFLWFFAPAFAQI